MEEKKITVTNLEKLSPIHKGIHESFEYTKYIAAGDGPDDKCSVSIYEIPPLKSNYPYHYHAGDEEIFYILSGLGILETPEGNKKVGPGDIIICPANKNGAHKLTNCSETEMLKYIEFDTLHKPELVFYPHTNKMGVLYCEDKNLFYDRDSTVGYYDGEA